MRAGPRLKRAGGLRTCCTRRGHGSCQGHALAHVATRARPVRPRLPFLRGAVAIVACQPRRWFCYACMVTGISWVRPRWHSWEEGFEDGAHASLMPTSPFWPPRPPAPWCGNGCAVFVRSTHSAFSSFASVILTSNRGPASDLLVQRCGGKQRSGVSLLRVVQGLAWCGLVHQPCVVRPERCGRLFLERDECGMPRPCECLEHELCGRV